MTLFSLAIDSQEAGLTFHSLQAAEIAIPSIHESNFAFVLSSLVLTDHSLEQSSRVPK